MKKVKHIIKKVGTKMGQPFKKIRNINIRVLSRIVLMIAVVMVFIVLGVLFLYKPARNAFIIPPESHVVVDVKSGDTLSKLLSERGFSIKDIDAISKTLKNDAGFTTLRAGKDKIDFVSPADGLPI